MPPSSRDREGLLYALGAFSFWGMVPIYFKAIAHVPPLEVLCHRIAWSVPVTALIISLGGQWPAMRASFGLRGVRRTLALTSCLVATNWFVFIYAVETHRILQCSLGYYMNPLVNVLLGMIFLAERLNIRQAVAVMLAAAGTLNLAVNYGEFPWISLALAGSFGTYGLLRKTVNIESVPGLFVESCLLSPIALVLLIVLALRGEASWGLQDPYTTLLLSSAGAITVLPLVWFTSAARRLPYSTVGVVQYLSPTLQLILAVFLYGESFTGTHLVTFILIWTGVFLYMADALWTHKRNLRALRLERP